MKKVTIVCLALAVIVATSLTADAQSRRRGRKGQSQQRSFPWKPPQWQQPQPAPQPQPQPSPTLPQNGLTFKNKTGKEIVMYIYKPDDGVRAFTWKDIRVPPQGTVNWPQADDQYAQLWLKGMEIGGLQVVAPEKLVRSTGVVNIYRNQLAYSTR